MPGCKRKTIWFHFNILYMLTLFLDLWNDREHAWLKANNSDKRKCDDCEQNNIACGVIWRLLCFMIVWIICYPHLIRNLYTLSRHHCIYFLFSPSKRKSCCHALPYMTDFSWKEAMRIYLRLYQFLVLVHRWWFALMSTSFTSSQTTARISNHTIIE